MLTTQTLGPPHGYSLDMTMPHIPPAGITTAWNESAKECLAWSNNGRPSTPPEMKKYRQSNIHEPGKVLRHYGTADDPLRGGVFGAPSISKPGESVAAYMHSYPESEVQRWKLERSEDNYASSKREPLGTGYQRGHNIPEHMGTQRPFGMTYGAIEKEREGQALHIMFPTDGTTGEEDPETRAMYLRSHGTFGPGEQRRRNYDWQGAGINPDAQRFGASEKFPVNDGVKKALQPNLDQEIAQPPTIATKLHEDYKLTAADTLGKPKKLGTGERNLPEDHVYGLSSLRFGAEPGVDGLFKNYSAEAQAPDADLGKSLRQGFRNTAAEDRVFGVPSVRTDVPLPKTRSVANTMNYGNEPGAVQLLAPPKSAERGIGDEHYASLRSKEDIRVLVDEAGIPLEPQEFEDVFRCAAQADGGASMDKCCLDTFFRARHAVLAQTLVTPMPF